MYRAEKAKPKPKPSIRVERASVLEDDAILVAMTDAATQFTLQEVETEPAN